MHTLLATAVITGEWDSLDFILLERVGLRRGFAFYPGLLPLFLPLLHHLVDTHRVVITVNEALALEQADSLCRHEVDHAFKFIYLTLICQGIPHIDDPAAGGALAL